MATVSVGLLLAWIFGPLIKVDATAAALMAIAALLLVGVLAWEDITRHREAWNTFIWFAVLLMMATFLGQLGLIKWFSTSVGSAFNGVGWVAGFLGLSLTYFYAHYFFASNTAQVGAMYAAFLAVAIALGTPPMLGALVLGFFSNLFACTTHYGTGPGPILFGTGNVSLGTWWKTGFAMSVVHIAIWLGIGALWWRMLGLW
jgi:DASS family divalent anion:Na+ symporter